ncbi:hypothetical protein K439DRAFT_686916 [Ramaria rubella]|nr:hypothetical protein K439DRAFT_686916 [Ramaria rubella]
MFVIRIISRNDGIATQASKQEKWFLDVNDRAPHSTRAYPVAQTSCSQPTPVSSAICASCTSCSGGYLSLAHIGISTLEGQLPSRWAKEGRQRRVRTLHETDVRRFDQVWPRLSYTCVLIESILVLCNKNVGFFLKKNNFAAARGDEEHLPAPLTINRNKQKLLSSTRGYLNCIRIVICQ